MRLVDAADVFVHSMRPAAATSARHRLRGDIRAQSADHLRFGPGYRQDGPHRDYPAYDDVVQGESGIAALMAQVNGEPRFYPTVIIDKFCGYVLASSIGMALYSRERTGQGQEVQVPMFETILSFNYLEHLWGARIRSAAGSGHRLRAPAHAASAPLQTKDGLYLRARRERRPMATHSSRRSAGPTRRTTRASRRTGDRVQQLR